MSALRPNRHDVRGGLTRQARQARALRPALLTMSLALCAADPAPTPPPDPEASSRASPPSSSPPESPPPDSPPQASLTQRATVPEGLRVGQPVALELTLTHSPGARVQAPSQAPGSRWSIVASQQQTQRGPDGSATTTITLHAVSWRAGTSTLGPLEVTLIHSDGQLQTLTTQPLTLKPLTTLPEPSAQADVELKPPQPPVSVWIEDYGPLKWGLGLGAGVLAILLTFLVTRRALRQAPAPAPAPPAHVLAMEALGELAATDLIERGDMLSFYTRLSEIVREYLGRQLGFPGTELTTYEIQAHLERQSWPAALAAQDVLEWLRHCDRTKFTEHRPSAPQAEGALRQAFSIVELTRAHQERLAQERAASMAAQAAPEERVAQAPTKAAHKLTSAPSVATADPSPLGLATSSSPVTPSSTQTSADPGVEATLAVSTTGMAAWAAILADADRQGSSDDERASDERPQGASASDESAQDARHDQAPAPLAQTPLAQASPALDAPAEPASQETP